MDRGLKRKGFAVIGVLLFCTMAMQAHAATITVTNTNDSGPGSLRQALAVAHDGDRITFAVSGAITLTSGGLGVTKNVTISGPGANQLAVDGNQATLVFGLPPQITVSISGLTIRNAQHGISNNQGTVSVSNCVISGNSIIGLYNYAGQGGASMTVANSIISNNSGTGAFNLLPPPNGSGCACMTITDSVVSNNNADGISNAGNSFAGTASLTVVNSDVSDNHGGGISNNDIGGNTTVTIVSTTLSGNLAGGVTDGITGATIVGTTVSGNSADGVFGFGQGNAQAAITDSTISGNSTHGGIRFVGNQLTVANSTISGNSSVDNGGGIYAIGFAANLPLNVSIGNSTISGNSAGTNGGGIYDVRSLLHVANSTISGNSAGSGGGIYNDGGADGGINGEISNTILNAGASGENIVNNNGLFNSLGYNLSSDDGGGYLNGPGDQIKTDPMLGPLQNNGGPTLTHMPLPGSPAIDAGDPNFTPPPLLDQRGPCFHRVLRRLDVGSVETQPERPCRVPRPRPTPPR